MQNRQIFKAFFSYARQDADADPRLIEALTKELEKRVNVRLANDHFKIWRDKDGLRTGDRWNPKIEAVLRQADILIVLLTPRWIGSDFCRKEYSIFEEVEGARMIGSYVPDYVAPILARDIEREKLHFTEAQNDIYARISSRQHQRAFATDFLKLSSSARIASLDKIADDIEGMIDRCRALPVVATEPLARPVTRRRKAWEFDGQAFNYEEVDFVSSIEVVLDRRGEGEHGVYAQVDFVERLYLQGRLGRIDFGVRRAYLSIGNEGPGVLSRIRDLKGSGDRQNTSYKTLQEAPEAISVCMDPPPGKSSLGELALPPVKNDRDENYLSRIAAVTADVKADALRAELIVSLNAEGLHLGDDKIGMSLRTQNKIKAIMDAAAAKVSAGNDRSVMQGGRLRRSLTVRERS